MEFHTHDSMWHNIMEKVPSSPMMKEMMWYRVMCGGDSGGMVDFVGTGSDESDESELYHRGLVSIHHDETTYGFLWQHDNFEGLFGKISQLVLRNPLSCKRHSYSAQL